MTLAAARALLRGAGRVVSFSGAGLSAESGIPTFREASGEGLWADYDPQKLASPEGFAADPDLVIDWYAGRRRAMAEAEPNPAHRALATRTDLTHITQNIDDLLERAGATGVIHLHGTMDRDRCHAECGYEEVVTLADPPGPRACPRCGAPMRPAVVWFGELLPMDAWSVAERACGRCDVLLVIGTSAVVHPAAGLIVLAKAAGAKIVLVNTEASEASHLADIELLAPAGEIVPALLAE